MHNNLVSILKFHDLEQEDSEPVQQFAARLNGAANICNFTIKCKCDQTVNFAENIQIFQLIRRLADSEIKEKILAETATWEMSLIEIIKYSEAVETGKRSGDVMSRSGSSNITKSGSLN